MSIDPLPPPQVSEDSLLPKPRSPFVLKLVIAVGVVLMLCIILGALATSYLMQPPPTLSDVTTAHGLANGALVNETHVFGVGDDVHIVYTIRGAKSNYTLAARITESGKAVNASSVTRALRNTDQGVQSLVFVPKEAGEYRAMLLLNNTSVPGADVMFKVMTGGAPIQEVTTAKSIDQRTYRPLDQSDAFVTRDTVNITYRDVNTHGGDRLAVVYYVEGRRQPEDARDHDSFDEAGTFRGFFSISGAETALAVGNYRAELFYNGDLVAVKIFRVTK